MMIQYKVEGRIDRTTTFDCQSVMGKLLYLHGNGGSLAGRAPWISLFAAEGLAVLEKPLTANAGEECDG